MEKSRADWPQYELISTEENMKRNPRGLGRANMVGDSFVLVEKYPQKPVSGQIKESVTQEEEDLVVKKAIEREGDIVHITQGQLETLDKAAKTTEELNEEK